MIGCMPLTPVPVVIVTGHYGVGKTNLSLNFALDAAAQAQKATLIDLDVVNPYFRSSDYRQLLEEHGVRLIAPVFAGTNLDAPSLSGGIAAALKQAQTAQGKGQVLIIDAGGDEVGAKALGRFAPLIAQGPYEMLYVVNRSRALLYGAQEAARLLRDIEAASHLRATAVVNNTHLQNETDEKVIARGIPFAKEVAGILDLPLACTTVPAALFPDVSGRESFRAKQIEGHGVFYPVQIYVRTPWDNQ